MKLHPAWTGPLTALLLFSLIAAADAAGIWRTESDKVPRTISEGSFAGVSDPGDIRGSYTFADIEVSFGVPAVTLARAFGVPEAVADGFACRELEARYPATGDQEEIGTGSVRTFVSIYTGIPYDGTDALPAGAVSVLRELGRWNDTLQSQFEELGRIVARESTDAIVDEAATHEEEGFAIGGQTTVNELLDQGYSLSAIQTILGREVENLNLSFRDVAESNGLSFSAAKEELMDRYSPVP